MRAVIGSLRPGAATRRDLLLETLALRHQLGVLARSNTRARPADRLFWLFLRWLWPRWREALVLIQPATVDRWHRESVRRCCRRRARRPGRPRIDSPCRDLIRRMAAENYLWGAPRIHGELLKLGIAISERTVSRYLRGRRPGVPRQYCVRSKFIDGGVAGRHSTGDASRHQDGCCPPTGWGDASRPPGRDSCPAPPTRRPRSFQ